MDMNTTILAGIGMVCLTILWIIRLVTQNNAERLATDAYQKADRIGNDLAQLRYRLETIANHQEKPK